MILTYIHINKHIHICIYVFTHIYICISFYIFIIYLYLLYIYIIFFIFWCYLPPRNANFQNKEFHITLIEDKGDSNFKWRQRIFCLLVFSLSQCHIINEFIDFYILRFPYSLIKWVHNEPRIFTPLCLKEKDF